MSEPTTSPVAVAGPPGMERALAGLAQRGRLKVPVRAVLLEPGEGAGGDTGGVRVLWRHKRASTRWVRYAIDALPDLAWLHSDFVGIDSLPVADLARRGVIVTNGSGNYSRPMAEWVLLAMLAAAKHLPQFVRQSDAGIWDPDHQLDELEGSVALFLGLGSVGSLAAPMAAAMGVEVRGVTRSPRTTVPPGLASMVASKDWRSHLPEADFVVCALPLTPDTSGMIDAEALSAMKPTAWLINVARGELIDEAALASALDRGEIGGAILDTFVEEPLPPTHPLWGRPNVVVIPHHTWSSPRVGQRMDELFATLFLAWVEGQPLSNQVDLVAGY